MTSMPRPLAAIFLAGACLLGLFPAASVHGKDFTSLQGEFWLDFQPMGKDGPQAPLSADGATTALLTEARTVFSAIIYGYDFSWRPADPVRKAEDAFTMTPAGAIAWGDPDMEFRETRRDESSLYLRVRYLVKPHEQARLEAWSRNVRADAAGTGMASYFDGPDGKLKAFMEACKSAIRETARGVTLNRPSMVSGRFVVAEMPRVIVRSGTYQYTVRLKLQLDGIDAYRSY
jgi:hypothetical protein